MTENEISNSGNMRRRTRCFVARSILSLVLDAGAGVGILMTCNQDPAVYGESISYATVKIPFALLRPSFQATIDPETGKEYPAVAYFPCSPFDPPPDAADYTWDGMNGIFDAWVAFLQAAFVGIQCDSDWVEQGATYWLAQAPEPANLSKHIGNADITGGIPFVNRTIASNAWTRSWSKVLPVLTIDADGTTLVERIRPPPALSGRER